ncbi:anaphase-promoting complex subunit 4 [Entomortierella parvispora]|uniref:Anaphase-promoting complex subunit 4 n=1 Tax=Entomortierella parvispora TaxID=205924 RepID=A0A9P3HGR7_9FUNG|nr:anaphase-promoting complex subunit 4 [Entomortierella parvispora]
MVTEANYLDIYRADWSKHRSIKLEGNASTLVWRPDGKVIAVGLSSGKISLYHYRDGSLVRKIEAASTAPPETNRAGNVHRSLVTIGPIDFLRWEPLFLGEPMERLFPQETSQKSILRKLPPQRPIPLSITAQKRAQATAFFRAKTDNEGDYGVEVAEPVEGSPDGLDECATYAMNVLIASDNQAHFFLQLFSGLQTKALALSELMKEYGNETYKEFKILDAAIQLDLGEMTIIASGTKLGDSDSELLQITLDSDKLHAHAQDIKSLGQKRRPVQLLLKYLKDAIGVLDADSETVYRNVEIARDEISMRLREKEELEAPGDALVMLFARHIPSEGLKEYLTSDLRQDGLQRWATSTEGAYRNMLKVIADCYLPCCERLHTHLNDLYGHVQTGRDDRDACGVDKSLLDACELDLKEMFRFAELLKQALGKEIEYFGEFKSWLATIIDGLVPSDAGGPKPRTKTTLRSAANLSKYIRSFFSTSGLRRFFENNDMDTEEGVNLADTRPPTTALVQRTFSERVADLQMKFSRIFEGPEVSVAHSICISNVMVLEPAVRVNSLGRVRTTYVDEPNLNICPEATVIDSWLYTIFHFAPQQNKGISELRVIRSRPFSEQRGGAQAISTLGDDAGVSSKVESWSLSLNLPSWVLLDMCFLNDQELAMCLRKDSPVSLFKDATRLDQERSCPW